MYMLKEEQEAQKNIVLSRQARLFRQFLPKMTMFGAFVIKFMMQKGGPPQKP
jgi:hypothetical protein